MLDAEGNLACWGCNDHGQLGDGSREDRAAPVPVEGLGRVTQVALGSDLSCVLDDEGQVWCWGNSDEGQCGLHGEDVTRPVMISGLEQVTRISVGGKGVCALRDDGALWCWGEDRYRTFAGMTARWSPHPVRVDQALGGQIVDVRADAADDVCVLDDEGTVTCWGADLGDWTELQTPATPQQRQRWFSERGRPIDVTRGVAGFLRHARPLCVWRDVEEGRTWECLDDEALRWGDVGRPPIGPRREWPQLALSERHGCAVEAGRVECWGADDHGQVGVEVTASLHDVTQVSTGPSHSCALLEQGTITCWGNPERFATGDATMAVTKPAAPPPVDAGRRRLTTMRGVVDVVAENTERPCALERAGTVRCLVEGRWRSVPGLADVVELSAGESHACARTTSGAVHCWGQWYFGPYNHDADDGDFLKVRRPRTIAGLRALAIESWGEVDYALARDGSVHGWGRTAEESLVPQRIVGPTSWIDIAMSERWSCGREADGTTRCWESFDDTSDAPEIELTNVAMLSVAGERGCALHQDGSVSCWGEGPVGDGTWMDRDMPSAVTGVGGVRDLSVGITHACARTTEGAVLCWGDNDEGQLGDGTTAAGLVPTLAIQARDLGPIAGVAVVSWRPHQTVLTSHTGTLVWTEQGEVWMWGESP